MHETAHVVGSLRFSMTIQCLNLRPVSIIIIILC